MLTSLDLSQAACASVRPHKADKGRGKAYYGRADAPYARSSVLYGLLPPSRHGSRPRPASPVGEMSRPLLEPPPLSTAEVAQAAGRDLDADAAAPQATPLSPAHTRAAALRRVHSRAASGMWRPGTPKAGGARLGGSSQPELRQPQNDDAESIAGMEAVMRRRQDDHVVARLSCCGRAVREGALLAMRFSGTALGNGSPESERAARLTRWAWRGVFLGHAAMWVWLAAGASIGCEQRFGEGADICLGFGTAVMVALQGVATSLLLALPWSAVAASVDEFETSLRMHRRLGGGQTLLSEEDEAGGPVCCRDRRAGRCWGRGERQSSGEPHDRSQRTGLASRGTVNGRPSESDADSESGEVWRFDSQPRSRASSRDVARDGSSSRGASSVLTATGAGGALGDKTCAPEPPARPLAGPQRERLRDLAWRTAAWHGWLALGGAAAAVGCVLAIAAAQGWAPSGWFGGADGTDATEAAALPPLFSAVFLVFQASAYLGAVLGMAGFGLVCAEVRLMLDELTLHTSAWAEEAARTHDHRTANHKALAAAAGGRLDVDPLGLDSDAWDRAAPRSRAGLPSQAAHSQADAAGWGSPDNEAGGGAEGPAARQILPPASAASAGSAAAGAELDADDAHGRLPPAAPARTPHAAALPGVPTRHSTPSPAAAPALGGAAGGGASGGSGASTSASALAAAAGPPPPTAPGAAAALAIPAAWGRGVADEDCRDSKEAFDTVTPLGSAVGPAGGRRGAVGLYGQQVGSTAGGSFHRAADSSDMGGDGREAICAAFEEVAGDAASAHGRHHAAEVAGIASARADALLQGFQAAAHYSFRVTEAFSLPVGGAVLAGFVLLLVTVVDILEWDHDSMRRPHNAGAAAAEAWLYVTLMFLVVWILVPLFNVGLVAERFHVFQRDASMSIVTSPAFRPLSHAEKALLATFFTGAHPAIHLLGVEVTLESLKEVVLMLVAAMTVLLKYKFDLEIEV